MAGENYLIGGARIFFNGGLGFRDIGNIPSVSLTRTIKELEHFTAVSGKRLLDKRLVTEASLGIKFKMDEFNSENLNALFLGDGAADASYTSGSVVDEVVTGYKDRYFFTAKNNISTVVLTNSAGTVTYVLNTDYTIDDAVVGAIKVLTAGAITDGQSLKIDYAYAAGTRKKIKAGKTFTVEGKARLVFKTLNGSPLEWVVNNCVLKVEGDTGLTSENWADSDFTLEILADTVVPTEPYGYIMVG